MSYLLFYVALLVIHVQRLLFVVVPDTLCGQVVYVFFCLRVVDWDGPSVASNVCKVCFPFPLNFLLLGSTVIL